MTVVCGLLRGAMQVISKYLTALREETTSARQLQGGSRRLAALIATAGDGRDSFSFLFFFPLTVLFPISCSYASNDTNSTQTEVTQQVKGNIKGTNICTLVEDFRLRLPEEAGQTWTGAAPVSPCVFLLHRPLSPLPQFRRPSMTQFGAAREGGSDGGREAGMF